MSKKFLKIWGVSNWPWDCVNNITDSDIFIIFLIKSLISLSISTYQYTTFPYNDFPNCKKNWESYFLILSIIWLQIFCLQSRWWGKYLSKRSLIKHTCSWRFKFIILWTMNRQTKILLGISKCIMGKSLHHLLFS